MAGRFSLKISRSTFFVWVIVHSVDWSNLILNLNKKILFKFNFTDNLKLWIDFWGLIWILLWWKCICTDIRTPFLSLKLQSYSSLFYFDNCWQKLKFWNFLSYFIKQKSQFAINFQLGEIRGMIIIIGIIIKLSICSLPPLWGDIRRHARLKQCHATLHPINIHKLYNATRQKIQIHIPSALDQLHKSARDCCSCAVKSDSAAWRGCEAGRSGRFYPKIRPWSQF